MWNRTTHSTPVQTGVVVFFPGSRVAVSTQSLRFALSSFLLLSLTENGLNECLGTLLRTTRRSRGGAARGGGTPSSTSKAPGSSARRRTFLCTFMTCMHNVRIRPGLQHPRHASAATQQGPLFGGTSLKHDAHTAGSRCRLSLALVRAASALLPRDPGAHPDTQCACLPPHHRDSAERCGQDRMRA